MLRKIKTSFSNIWTSLSPSTPSDELVSEVESTPTENPRKRRAPDSDQKDIDSIQTPPIKRQKDNQSRGFKSFFNFKRLSESPWNITQIYRYVVDGKSQAETESDLPSDAVDESAATPIRKYMLRSKSVEKDVVIIDDDPQTPIDVLISPKSDENNDEQINENKSSETPLQQLSTTEVVDLTAEEGDASPVLSLQKEEEDHNMLAVTRQRSMPSLPSKYKSDTSKKLVGVLARQRSATYLDENVRLEEKKRYKEILAQFTTVNLPDYSESLSPGITQSPSREALNIINQTQTYSPSVENLSTSFPSRYSLRSTTATTTVDLTEDSDDEVVIQNTPRRNFFFELLSDKTNATIVIDDQESSIEEPKPQEDKEFCTPPLTKATSFHETLLGSDWIDKWRKTLDPIALERQRQIDVEERKRKEAEERKKEELERLKKEQEEKEAEAKKQAVNEFPELTSDALQVIKRALSHGNPGEVFAKGFNAEITRGDLCTLRGSTWLNDEVVNFYFNLVKQRNEENNLSKVHVFNTFFYPKIIKMGHAGVKRWTRKIDVFSFDLILIPVHLGMHWCLAAIDFQNKQIAYYDSLKGNNGKCLQALSEYLQAESLDKKKVDFDFNGWTEVMPKDIPEQLNGSDCGVFMCKYAEYKSRYAEFTFTQDHIPYFRKRMVYEIISQKLM